MDHVLTVLITAAACAAVSVTLTPPLIRAAGRLGLLQAPDEPRRIHKRPLPKIGGLAIFVAFVAGLGVTFMLPVHRFPVELERIVLLLAGAVIVVGVMLYDDLVGLAPLPKLLWQIAAAAIVILPRLRGPEHGLIIDQFRHPLGGEVHLPVLAGVVVTLLWIVVLMNTMNWLDGLDGLAGSVTFIASAVLFIHTFFRPPGNPQFTISLLALLLGVSVLGFLPYNWHPARIMMGDVGSMFLGFALATIAIIGGAKIATALLTLWLPILDLAWVIVYRVLNGRSPLHADRGHLHHRLLDLGWSQQRIVLFVAGISAMLGAISLLLPSPALKLFTLIAAGALGLVLLAALARHSSQVPSASMSDFQGDPSRADL